MQRFKIDTWEGVALIRASGPLTLDGMRQLREEVLRTAMRSEVHRVLCDLLGAVVMLTREEWRIFALQTTSEHAVGVPTGLLVAGAAIEPARDLCNQLNSMGRIALAFSASPPAYRWLGVPMTRPSASREVAVRG